MRVRELIPEMADSLDVTVYDYADSDRQPVAASGRMKKAAVNAVNHEVKEMCGPTPESQALTWFEKNLSDFDSDSETEENALNSEDEDIAEILHNLSMKKKTKHPKSETKMCREGFSYPVEVWWMVSDFVQPEDVGIFAAICRTTHMITHTARFWIKLYHRYYNINIPVPDDLKPTCMERHHGIKARVIQALFHLHKPFIERTKVSVPFEVDLYSVEAMKCQLMWYETVKNKWHFSFKFEKRSKTTCPLTNTMSKSKRQDLFHGYNDVDFNPDRDCAILQVWCLNFISIPSVMGLLLKKAYLNVSQNMLNHKLKLHFGPHQTVNSNVISSSDVLVTLDPVVNIKVLRWWDTLYPRSIHMSS
ncbi:transmembrane protein 183B isoform X2 [Lingula anatina]|uniref:Transmembrane protein 183B isoform X2 n=1 Tax=Lingula anatina TaxID=7574 RepID=A0A1S3KB41_LINAN|nr:transmembrane protein 183B isoform X2 [Lingula anatina]|eukprot:XP_013419476.1 transmembrane protein 183B isoform X2 [Lingula anatina]